MALAISVKKYEARLMHFPQIGDLFFFLFAQLLHEVVSSFESPNLVSPVILEYACLLTILGLFPCHMDCPVCLPV